MALRRSIAAVLHASVARAGPHAAEVAGPMVPDDLEGLAQAAWLHGIPGYVRAALLDCRVLPPQERELLDDLRHQAVRRHLRTIGDLRFLAEVFQRAAIPWAVIKGPVLGEPLHGSPDLRWYNDVDVLVTPAHFGQAVHALEAAGCAIPAHDWSHLRKTARAEIDVWLPSGTHLDLHWHLVIDSDVRQHFTIDLDQLFERRRHVEFGALAVPTLDADDTMVYVALHAVLGGADRLLHLKDLQLLTENLPVDRVFARAHEWQAELALRTALRRVELSIGLPAGVALGEAPSAMRSWDRLVQMAFRASPPERQDGGASVGRLVSRATRGAQRGSLSALGRNAWIVVRHGSQGARRWPWQRSVSEAEQHGSDGERVEQRRTAYLEAVSRC